MSHSVIHMAEASARWSARHPWRAVASWLLLVGAAIVLLMVVPTSTVQEDDYWQGESGRASQMSRDAGLEPPPTESVLIVGDRDEASQMQQAAAEVADRMIALDGVADVGDAVSNADRTAILVEVVLADPETDVAPLQAVTARVAADHPDLEVEQAGAGSIDDAVGDLVAEDLRSAEVTSIPVTLVLMLVAFGALVAAGIPVLLAIGSVITTIGLMAPLSHLVPAEESVTSMIVLIGMAVGVDYSLFFLKREREERAAGRSSVDAVEIAAATSGHSILVSGGAVIAAMTGLFIVGGATFTSLATGAVVVVAVAVLGSISVLPAVLVLLGPRVDRPRVPLLWRLNRRTGPGAISRHVLDPVVRRPGVSTVLALVLLGALAAPTLGMKIGSGGLETLPGSIAEVQTITQISTAFPGQMLTVDVLARGSDPDAVREGLRDLEDAAIRADDGLVAAPGESIRPSADGRTAMLTLGIDRPEDSDDADAAVRTLREQLAPEHLAGSTDEYAVGGTAGTDYDAVHRLTDRMPFVIAYVLLLTLVIMGLTFRSGVIALLSAGLNLLSVGVAFGVMTLVFQHGWASELMDFSAPGYLIEWVPLFVMVVLVGLSMDYHVFVLSRVREHVAAGLPSRLAVQRGVMDTAGVVTSAAAVMVAVFSIFAVLSMMELKMLGVGLAVAILVDATVIRLVALPAILMLLGDRAWRRVLATAPRDELVAVEAEREDLVTAAR